MGRGLRSASSQGRIRAAAPVAGCVRVAGAPLSPAIREPRLRFRSRGRAPSATQVGPPADARSGQGACRLTPRHGRTPADWRAPSVGPGSFETESRQPGRPCCPQAARESWPRQSKRNGRRRTGARWMPVRGRARRPRSAAASRCSRSNDERNAAQCSRSIARLNRSPNLAPTGPPRAGAKRFVPAFEIVDRGAAAETEARWQRGGDRRRLEARGRASATPRHRPSPVDRPMNSRPARESITTRRDRPSVRA